MLPPMNTGWPKGFSDGGRLSWPGRKGAGRAFAVDEEGARLSVDEMRLDLAGVVRNVEQQRQAAIGKEVLEDAPRVRAEDLAIGERAVHRRPHGAEIAAADLRRDPRAGEVAVRKRNSRLLGRDHHLFRELGRDLMAESPRAAMTLRLLTP